MANRPVGRAVAQLVLDQPTVLSLEWDVWKFQSRTGQIEYNLANDRRRCAISLKEAVLAAGALTWRYVLQLVTRFSVLQQVHNVRFGMSIQLTNIQIKIYSM